MAADIRCPKCEHGWLDYDLFDEDEMNIYKERLEAKDQLVDEIHAFLKRFVDEFDKTPGVCPVNRVLTKAEIQKMRRLVENAE